MDGVYCALHSHEATGRVMNFLAEVSDCLKVAETTGRAGLQLCIEQAE